jgi:hypothetical protein
VLERTSRSMQDLLTTDRDVLTWWASRVEAALAGREREA